MIRQSSKNTSHLIPAVNGQSTMPKADHSKRLKRWMSFLRETRSAKGHLPIPHRELLGWIKLPPPSGWGLDTMRAHAERAYSALSPHTISESTRQAFEQSGLDPTNPNAWRLLIYIFAEAHFGTRSYAGAPSKWTDQRWCQLLSDIQQIKSKLHLSDDEGACRRLIRKWPKRYPGTTKSSTPDHKTLRRNLSYARDPKRNNLLKVFIEMAAKDEE